MCYTEQINLTAPVIYHRGSRAVLGLKTFSYDQKKIYPSVMERDSYTIWTSDRDLRVTAPKEIQETQFLLDFLDPNEPELSVKISRYHKFPLGIHANLPERSAALFRILPSYLALPVVIPADTIQLASAYESTVISCSIILPNPSKIPSILDIFNPRFEVMSNYSATQAEFATAYSEVFDTLKKGAK